MATPNNVCLFTGRIATKQLQLAQSTIPIARFSFAVDKPLPKAKRNDPNVKKADFLNMVAFNQDAENIVKWCKAGTWLQIMCHVNTDEWTDQNQQRRFTTEFVVDSFSFLNTGGGNNNSQGAQAQNRQAPAQYNQQAPQQQYQQPAPQQPPQQPAFEGSFYAIEDDEDLPF